MAEWLARWTGNPAGPGLESRSGHLLDLFSVVPSLNPRPCQVLNRKLYSCLLPIGFFDPVMCYHEDQRSPSSFILGMLGNLQK